ncbi:MAG: VanW family protein, partial [Clostridia bacterium]|nr:VanW family protein [Clostridia bacterium]
SKNHSLPVSYVPVGLDAMVSESNDLILKNDTDYPVFIDAECDGSKVTFTLYGTKPTEEIRLWSKKEMTFPCDEYECFPGSEEKVLSEPKDGSLYLSFRDYYKNGVLVKREKLRTSEYRKVKGKKITVAMPTDRRENQDFRKDSSIKMATFL